MSAAARPDDPSGPPAALPAGRVWPPGARWRRYCPHAGAVVDLRPVSQVQCFVSIPADLTRAMLSAHQVPASLREGFEDLLHRAFRLWRESENHQILARYADDELALSALLRLGGAAEWLRRIAVEPQTFGDAASLADAHRLHGEALAYIEAKKRHKGGRPKGSLSEASRRFRDLAAELLRDRPRMSVKQALDEFGKRYTLQPPDEKTARALLAGLRSPGKN